MKKSLVFGSAVLAFASVVLSACGGSGANAAKPVTFFNRQPSNPDTGEIDMAKYQIYELINKMATAGKTILVVSSEMPEILGITNRIAVLSNHQLAGIVETKKTNQEELLTLCAKCL
jgi:ABC-type sugar transport system, ATPase component